MNKKFQKSLLVGAVALLMVAGCLSAAVMDKTIEANIKASYVFRSYLKGDDVKVLTKDGVVTLTGTVKNENHMIMAVDTVADMKGVKSVENKLEVAGGIPVKHSDAWIHMRLETMLKMHRDLESEMTAIEVKDGNVVLQGVAYNEAQKALIGLLVKEGEGVKEVDNQMTLEKERAEALAEKREGKHRTLDQFIDDSSIKAQVKWALLFHRGTNPFQAEIHVHKGIVTISGKAEDLSQKELVAERIKDIHGVKKIINNLIIEKK
jgi:hyperosmotically inducible protein